MLINTKFYIASLCLAFSCAGMYYFSSTKEASGDNATQDNRHPKQQGNGQHHAGGLAEDKYISTQHEVIDNPSGNQFEETLLEETLVDDLTEGSLIEHGGDVDSTVHYDLVSELASNPEATAKKIYDDLLLSNNIDEQSAGYNALSDVSGYTESFAYIDDLALQHISQEQDPALVVGALSYLANTQRDDEVVRSVTARQAYELLHHVDPDVQSAALSAFVNNASTNEALSEISNVIYSSDKSDQVKIGSVDQFMKIPMSEGEGDELLAELNTIANDEYANKDLRLKALEVLRNSELPIDW